MRPSCRPNLRGRFALVPAGALLAGAVLSAQATTAVVDPCDLTLLRPTGDPLAYGRRGERCEGLYIKEVAGSGGLLVASFVESGAPFEIASGERLQVAWSPPAEAAVRLRAVALQRRVYYRMDVVRDRARTFEWPADVLVSLGLQPRDVGVVGWVERQVRGALEEVYLPLRLGKAAAPARTGRYVLRVVPAAELQELYVTVTTLDGSGRETSAIQRDVPLGLGFYPAERAVSIPLPALSTPGLYQIHLGATLRRGGPPANRTIVFYHGAE
jgi:hypothetical protein